MIKPTTVDDEAIYQDLVKIVKRYDHKTPMELLAIAANVVGKLIALQDKDKVTPEMAMEVVLRNIEMGNAQVINQKTEGNA